MPPTIASDVETGRPRRVIQKMARAAARHTVNDPATAFTAPSRPRVWAAPAPLKVAPRITKTVQMTAAVSNRTMRLPTAVPKTLAV